MSHKEVFELACRTRSNSSISRAYLDAHKLLDRIWQGAAGDVVADLPIQEIGDVLGMTSRKSDCDPNGLDQHALGAKLDAGKPLPALVLFAFARALSEVTKVGTYGANKYTPNGWLSVPDGENRYMEAVMRHLLDYAMGERIDHESGLPTLAHAIWNLLAVIELQQRAANVDA